MRQLLNLNKLSLNTNTLDTNNIDYQITSSGSGSTKQKNLKIGGKDVYVLATEPLNKIIDFNSSLNVEDQNKFIVYDANYDYFYSTKENETNYRALELYQITTTPSFNLTTTSRADSTNNMGSTTTSRDDSMFNMGSTTTTLN